MSRRFSVLLILGLLLLAACAAPEQVANPPASGANQAPAGQATQEPAAAATVALAAPTEAPTAAPATPAPTKAPQPTAAPVDAASPAPTATQATSGGASAPAAGSLLRLVLVADGTEARYKAREVLAGRSLPSDAVGTTKDVTGQIVIQSDGKLVPGQSKVSVNLGSLQSDQAMRDGFIKRSTLEVSQYPTADFVPTAIEGLPSPLPTAGDVNFTITGDMTVHGVTKPATWQVTGKVAGNEMTGTATYSFNFDDFNLRKPQVPRVLSLEDTIKLELDFQLVKQ